VPGKSCSATSRWETKVVNVKPPQAGNGEWEGAARERTSSGVDRSGSELVDPAATHHNGALKSPNGEIMKKRMTFAPERGVWSTMKERGPRTLTRHGKPAASMGHSEGSPEYLGS